ncbi:Cytochrome P450 E-class group I protein [Dioscorea alata]|uniref:Cytochrome P450 E-class group I protein n=1 Tax=Dioscorea alata TaxID=55571 RepID=A0ACB7V076_DIOAL|nr:Cytochrome P450 E-class group I protein [Dioscorea alata]
MEMEIGYTGMVLGALLVIISTKLCHVFYNLIWKPYQITKSLEKQGLRGPPYKFPHGSQKQINDFQAAADGLVMDSRSHDISSKLLPHYHVWSSLYGRTFFYWMGAQPRICLGDPEMVKQVLSSNFGFYPKPYPGPNIMALLGKGLVLAEGSDWARHRRALNPAFHIDKLKMMTKTMAECAVRMLHEWRSESKEAVEMSRQFQELTANIISHTVFGTSNSIHGKQIFLAQKELLSLVVADFGGSAPKYLPTKKNLKKWNLEKSIKTTLTNIIKNRLDNSKELGYGDDLLGLMLHSSMTDNNSRLTIDEIIDECKTFYFAGHETTSHLLTWTMFLLSINPEWQQRLREEVLSECGLETPNADMLGKFRLVTMVLWESLRLYPPVILNAREASKDMNLGGLMIPKGMPLMIPMVMLHRDKKYWGDDANDFNPLRFENGASKAAMHPNSVLPFSLGPRACIGQNFAMIEAKLVMAMILQRFSFSLSPKYKHSPANWLTLQPQFGLPIDLKPLQL